MLTMSEKMEAKMASQLMRRREDAKNAELLECPPISERLIRHLRLKFADPVESAKPNNPQLAQLLTIQYGVEKVLHYLEDHYQAQTIRARREHGI